MMENWAYFFTIISGLSTAVMAYLTYRTLKENKKNIETNNKILQANEDNTFQQIRPYVVLSLYSENLSLMFRIENIGKTPAKDVKISIEPELKNLAVFCDVKIDYEKLLNQSFLAPNIAIQTVLSSTIELYENKEKLGFHKVNISYKTLEDKELYEEYTININDFLGGIKSATFSNQRYLNMINKSIKKLSEIIYKK